MINTYCEAENYMELYRFACAAEERFPNSREERKKYWIDHFYLDFPKCPENPVLLRRALLITAGWLLFHETPRQSAEETASFLSEWYTAVMTCAANCMDEKAEHELLDKVSDRNVDFKSKNYFENLDKINYYRLACQAKANGPLRQQDIKIPFRIVRQWFCDNVKAEDRALHILYHYCCCDGPPDLTKTEVAFWVKGTTSNIKFLNSKHGFLSIPFTGINYDVSVQTLKVDEKYCWDDGEPGVILRECDRLPWLGIEKKLCNVELEKQSPLLWEENNLSSPDEMLHYYGKRKDLKRGGERKTSYLKCAILGMFWYAAKGRNPSELQAHGENMADFLPESAEISDTDWDSVKMWLEQYGETVIATVEQIVEFFHSQHEGVYFLKADKNRKRLQFIMSAEGVTS